MAKSNRVILALDFSDLRDILCMADWASEYITTVKIGLQAFSKFGPTVVRALQDADLNVFLDLKLHDIPNTVHYAVGEICDMGCTMTTVHALGGPRMLEEASYAAEKYDTKILGVTTLTSVNSTQPVTRELGKIAIENGADGLVSSALDLGLFKGLDGIRVCPGIRLGQKYSPNDHKRICSPAQAARNGADYIVVGRPVTESNGPEETLRAIIQNMESANGAH